jgi:hypothetical protein
MTTDCVRGGRILIAGGGSAVSRAVHEILGPARRVRPMAAAA